MRQRILAGQEEGKPAKTFRFYPKVYKAAIAAAGQTTFEEYSAKVAISSTSSRSRCATSWT